ncbi:MAG: PilZ domain-containing protein [Nitrospirota bacterium]
MSKRSSDRKKKRLTITFSDGNVENNGMSSDFSSTGLFIRTRKAFNPGTPVTMVLEVDINRKIPLAGVVARAIKTGVVDFKNGMGIRLTSIPQAYEEFLKELN